MRSLLEIEQLVKGDYILLDLPYYGNVGDVLIWQATLEMLSKCSAKCLFSCSIETYARERIRIGKDVTLVFIGGGNFGDLWKRHQLFRERVLQDFPFNPVLQLPQSVFFEDEKFLNEDIRIFSGHKAPVTICLRDQKSYDFIKDNYVTVKPILAPDMVVGFDVNKYYGVKNKGNGVLMVARDDKEKSVSQTSIPYDEKSDWPTMTGNSTAYAFHIKVLSVISRFLRLCGLRNLALCFKDWYYKNVLKDLIIRSGIKYLDRFETVVSTRLHAGVLAGLMGKQVVLIDNSYGKVKGVYDLWMKEWQNVKMI